MKVLMVCPSYPPREGTCGVGDYTRCLSEELSRQGVDVVVATSTGYRGRSDGPVSVRSDLCRWTQAGAQDVVALLGRTGATVLHLQYAPDLYRSGFALAPAVARLRRPGVRTVVTFHSLTGPSVSSRVAAAGLLLSAHHCISSNEEVSAMIQRRLPCVWTRCSEIPIGSNIPAPSAPIRAEAQPEARRRLGLPEAGPLAVFFGMVYPGKGLETLLDAWPVVRTSFPNACLVIAGDARPENRGYRQALEQRAERLSIGQAIVWTGRRPEDEVSRILHLASVFVAPYDGGLSIRHGSLMAGLAQGLPVVSTESSLPSKYLRDGEQVALVPPRDPSALAIRIIGLLRSPELAARLGGAAAMAAERFAWTRIAEDTRRVYARLGAA
jgi:glycosyltransferase involved in cell wall biosynthesis